MNALERNADSEPDEQQKLRYVIRRIYRLMRCAGEVVLRCKQLNCILKKENQTRGLDSPLHPHLFVVVAAVVVVRKMPKE